MSLLHMKVSPDPALRDAEARGVAHTPLFADAEPVRVLGGERRPPLVTAGLTPSAHRCFGPRGAALLPDGSLWVADTGHHRLLGWRAVPGRDGAPADLLIGQPAFDCEGRNAKGPVGPTTLNVPTGVCACGESGLAVADAWNHRVLIWRQAPDRHNQPPDVVLGQTDFTAGEANRGGGAAADSFHWPYGVAWADGHLFVADAENRRVLVWRGLPEANGQPADLVLGQRDFVSRDENAGGEPSAMSMRWPHGIALWRGRLCVADAGNNRIMVWDGIPDENGAPCDWVLGQSDFTAVDHNQSLYWPRATSLNMPYALAASGDWLLVADTANSRLLGWHIDDLATGAPARRLAGQRDFHEKGDNRWQPPAPDSFCWPYGLTCFGDRVVVADSGNNRVSLWRLAP